MEHLSETLVLPKSEVDGNTEIIPKIELDPDTDVTYKNIDELVLMNTEALLLQPKLEFPIQNEIFPIQNEIDPTLTPKLEPGIELQSSVEPLLESKSESLIEPNSEPHAEPKSESVSEGAALDTSLIEPALLAQDEYSNATSDDSDELPNLSVDEEDSAMDSLFRNIPEVMESTPMTLEAEASTSSPSPSTSPSPSPSPASSPITITEELPSTAAAAEATAAPLIEEIVDVESDIPQVVDLTEEEGSADIDIVEVLQVEENVIYDGSVLRSEERKRRRRRKRERREQRAYNSISDSAYNNETIEINDVDTDVEDEGPSTSHLGGACAPPPTVTVDIEAFTVPESPPDRLSPPPLRQMHNANNDIPFMNNNTQNHNIEIDFQDPNLLFGNLLGSPMLEHVDDGIPFLRANSPDIFPMPQMGEQHHPEQVVRPLSPQLFDLIPMERPPRPVRRTRMATRNAAAAAAAADRSRSRSPLGGGGGDDDDGGGAAVAANYAAFERLLGGDLNHDPPAAGPPRMLMGIPDFPHNSNMDMQHLHMHLPLQPQPRPPIHPPAAAVPIPPRRPSPPPRAGSLSCPICLDTLGSIQAQRRNLVSTVCGHVFCSHCLEESLKARKECPTCRKKLTKKQYHPIYI
ncbi:unnamed protein product [Meganyctiphanes norvegica]|uniref:RING-type domain-containing protein n=1 Tax=Meganyctiphanes norvegica TaxID=48144 RepID=A0AAV2RQA7_MEGNR